MRVVEYGCVGYNVHVGVHVNFMLFVSFSLCWVCAITQHQTLFLVEYGLNDVKRCSTEKYQFLGCHKAAFISLKLNDYPRTTL